MRCLGIIELERKNYAKASSLLENAADAARRLGHPGNEFACRSLLWPTHAKPAKDPAFEKRRLLGKLNALIKGLDPTIPEVKQYLTDVSLSGKKWGKK